MKQLQWVLVGALALGCGLGCGDSSSGGSGTVAEGTTFDMATEEQLNQICEANRDNVQAVTGDEAGCKMEALADAEDKAQCQTMLDACLAGAQDRDPCADMSQDDDSGFESCSIEVAQVEDCIGELADFIRGISCDDLGKDLKEPDCVKVIDRDCPELFSGDDGSGGDGGSGGGGSGAGGSGGDGGSGGGDGGSGGSGGGGGEGTPPGEPLSCGPVTARDACTGCLVNSCCRQITTCSGDDDCGCFADCFESEEGLTQEQCLSQCGLSELPADWQAFANCRTDACDCSG